MFPDFSKLIPGNYDGDGDYVYKKLLENGISVVPGKNFTKNKYFNNFARISFSATPLNIIEEAAGRMKEIFK